MGARAPRGPVAATRLDPSQRGAHAVVHDAHGPQIGARLHEVDPQTLAAAHDPFGADAFSVERRHGGVPDGIVRYARDIVAAHAEMAQGDRHVRLRAAEVRDEVARFEQSFLTGWAEPQEQLAERDHPYHPAWPPWRPARG